MADLPCFKDSTGREWRISPSLGLFDAIQEATGVDLIPDGNDISTVMSLPMHRKKLSDVLWAAIAARAKESGVSRETFRESIDGDVLTAGWGALLDAIVFFTPSSKRSELEAAIEMYSQAMDQGAQAIIQALKSEATSEAITQALEESIQGLPKALATGAMSAQAS